MKCNKDAEFVVLKDCGHIEKRYKNGTFICSICCEKCLKDLKKAIKELKRK